MLDLTKLTIPELEQLADEITKELKSRQPGSFDKEVQLSGKAFYPCTYEQIKLATYLADQNGSRIEVNNSQLMKRLEKSEMSKIIDLLKAGKKIRIY